MSEKRRRYGKGGFGGKNFPYSGGAKTSPPPLPRRSAAPSPGGRGLSRSAPSPGGRGLSRSAPSPGGRGWPEGPGEGKSKARGRKNQPSTRSGWFLPVS